MKRNKHIITLLLVISGLLSSQECEDGYTYFAELPNNTHIISGDSCLHNDDLDALNDLISANNHGLPKHPLPITNPSQLVSLYIFAIS